MEKIHLCLFFVPYYLLYQTTLKYGFLTKLIRVTDFVKIVCWSVVTLSVHVALRASVRRIVILRFSRRRMWFGGF